MALSDGFENLPPDDDDPKLPDSTVPDASATPPDPGTQATPVDAYISFQNPQPTMPSGLIPARRGRAGDLQAPTASPLAGRRVLPNGQIVNYGQPAPFDPTATNTASVASVVPAASTPGPTASAVPPVTPGPISRGLDKDPADAAVSSLRAYQTAASAQPATPFSPGASSTGDIDPDSAVSIGLPASPANTPAASAAPAPAPQPTSIPSSIPSQAGTAASGTGNGVDPDLSAMLGGGDDSGDEARAAYARDNRANLRYLKSQGGLTNITPTGQEVPATDTQGNQLYRTKVTNPLWRDPADGTAYRLSQSQYGDTHSFPIAQGVDGEDFKTDPQTGEQYVQVNGADGGSRREVVGQNPHIPAANGIKALAQNHQDNAEQASQAAAQAAQGVAGAEGYGSLSLAQLRQSQSAASEGVAAAQKTIDSFAAYKARGNGFNATQLNQLQAASDAVSHYGGLAQEQADEIEARQSSITQARQQQTASMGAVRDLAYVRNQIADARQNDDAPLTRNLRAVLSGQPIDGTMAKRYSAAGLLNAEPQGDGSAGLRLSEAGASLLPRDVQQQVQAARTQRASQAAQQQIVSQHPGLAQPGSPESVAFLNAFRSNGGDLAGAVQSVYGR